MQSHPANARRRTVTAKATALRIALWSEVVLSFFMQIPAHAQRTDDNAIADAEDAFGSNDGGEDLGLYGPFDVRGFSPIDAGNVRLEGLYLDRKADLNPRLVEGNRIRVGPSASNYPFPAPSGIVDYRLRLPDEDAGLSVVAQANTFGGALLEVDATRPISDHVRLGVGISQNHAEYASGNNADLSHTAAIAHWNHDSDTDAKIFWSRTRIVDEDIFPIVLGDGANTPPRIKRRRFLGQPWADVETKRFNYGAIARGKLHGLSIRAGVFRSVNDVLEGHSVFLQSAPLGDVAARMVSAIPGREASSTSGELGMAYESARGAYRQRIQFVARLRAEDRRYGGTQRLSLAPAPFGQPDYIDRPTFLFGTQTDDLVRQSSLGLAYQATFADYGRLNAGIQSVDYRKDVTTPSGRRPPSRDDPWLFNVSASANVNRWAEVFGSYTTGLEESDVAPEIAINRDEAPPALRTQQIDVGVKTRLGPVALIASVFDIERPYYGVDGANVFKQLGNVRHRGGELSLTGSPTESLTLVAGGTFVQARLSGEEVATGAIGPKPVDVPAIKMIASGDWRAPGSATSVDLAVEHIGSNTGDALNRVQVAPITTVDLGFRYRFRISGANAVLRMQVTNLFNEYGWEVAGNNAFIYIQSRQLLARVALDL